MLFCVSCRLAIRESLCGERKGKVVSVHAMKVYMGNRDIDRATISLISALDGREWPTSHSGRFTFDKESVYPLQRGLVGPTVGLEVLENRKNLLPL